MADGNLHCCCTTHCCGGDCREVRHDGSRDTDGADHVENRPASVHVVSRSMHWVAPCKLCVCNEQLGA